MFSCGYNPDIVRVCDDLRISWHCPGPGACVQVLPRCEVSSGGGRTSIGSIGFKFGTSSRAPTPAQQHTATGDSAGRIDQMLPKRDGGWPLVIYRHILQGQGQPPPKHLFSIHCNPNPLKPEKLSFTQTWGLQVLFCKNSGQQWQRRQSCLWRRAVAVLSTLLNRNFPKQYLLSPQIIRTKGIY